MIDLVTAGSLQIVDCWDGAPRTLLKAMQWTYVDADLPLPGSFHLKLVTLEVGTDRYDVD
jgi:hypothetical protein